MVFGSRKLISKLPDFQISLLGKVMVPASTARDLGVVLDPNLSFDDNITKTVSSCMESLGQINCVSHIFNQPILITVVNAIVFSKLFYSSAVWSNTTEKNIRKLQL